MRLLEIDVGVRYEKATVDWWEEEGWEDALHAVRTPRDVRVSEAPTRAGTEANLMRILEASGCGEFAGLI